MKKFITIMTIIVLSTSNCFSAVSYTSMKTNKESLAKELVKLINIEDMISKMFPSVLSVLMKTFDDDDATTEDKMIFEVVQNETKQFMIKKMTPIIIDSYVDIYTNEFTHHELHQLVDFYNTPVGRKLVKVTPDILNKGIKDSDRIIEKAMVQLMMNINDELNFRMSLLDD